jgi:hypothetical protein
MKWTRGLIVALPPRHHVTRVTAVTVFTAHRWRWNWTKWGRSAQAQEPVRKGSGKRRKTDGIQRPDALRAATASRRNDSASTESAAIRSVRRRPPASTTSESSAPPHWAAPTSRPSTRLAPARENAANRSMPISTKAGCARRHAAKARPPAAANAHAGGNARPMPPNCGASVTRNASEAIAIPMRSTPCSSQDGRKAIRGIRGACARRAAEIESRPANAARCVGAVAVSLEAITSGP